MYAFCAIRYVSRKIAPVVACDSAEGFVFVEGPATNSVHCIHYYCMLSSDYVVASRLGTALTPVSSVRTISKLAFVPKALIVPLSLKNEAGVLLHS